VAETTVQRESWLDQGFEVLKEDVIYVFNNGVKISRTMEQDLFPAELACAECFISYKVLDAAGLPLLPARQNFANTCREAFWIKYHSS
jgi:hypothetical protein